MMKDMPRRWDWAIQTFIDLHKSREKLKGEMVPKTVRDTFIGGNVRPEVKDALEMEAEEKDVSVSKLLDQILAEYYSLELNTETQPD